MRSTVDRRLFLTTVGSAFALPMLQAMYARLGGRALAGDVAPPMALAITPAVPARAAPLPLSDVRLTGGPLKAAQDADIKDLLALDCDRMMYFLRQRAGLEPKAGQGYQGWDGDGNGRPNQLKQLNGHIAGHYLSAVSYMYAATGDPEFKRRADYLVSEFAAVQEKYGDGYIGALTNATGTPGRDLFQQVSAGTIRSGGFDLNGMWSPWYVQHKLFAGLRDAYRLTGNKDALRVETRFAAWVESVLKPLNDQQVQQMLGTEFGGMNEVLADLYADTGEKRWYDLSGKFQHVRVITPLSNRQDILGGLHGNTQVPKLLGELKRYIYVGDKADGTAATFFWEAVVYHHSFATGGHGYDEYFGPPDRLSPQVDGTGQRSADLRTCESCNVYNMLKMTRELFAIDPDIRYAEFMERALFNHVLASIDPATGRTCYMVPIGMNVAHEYQDMAGSFTCCVGSGYESHALHADGMYCAGGNQLWVNLYAPSTARWAAGGMALAVETDFPMGETVTLKITEAPAGGERTLLLRHPAWATQGFGVKINGVAMAAEYKPGSYVPVQRAWKAGDTVTVTMPRSLHAEALPDNPNRMAILWGPLVLAGDLGPVGGARGRGRGTPTAATYAITSADKTPERWLKPIAGKPGTFTASTVSGQAITFQPFYTLAQHRYGVYWDLYTPGEWAKAAPDAESQAAAQQRLAAITVGYVQPGQMQPETDHNFQGENTEPVTLAGQPGRKARGWFSLEVPVEANKPMTLVVTYANESAKRTFDLLVDGVRLASPTLEPAANRAPVQFTDQSYSLPADMVKGKQKITVKFQATGGNETASIFGLRVIKPEE